MSVLTIHYPVADIGGSLRNIALQYDMDYLHFACNGPAKLEGENIDIDALIETLQGTTKCDVFNVGLMRLEAGGEYVVEKHQYVLAVRIDKGGPAVWSDGARTIRLDLETIISCPYGKIKAEAGSGGLYLIFDIH